MILFRLLFLPVRLVAGSMRAGWRVGRAAGTGRVAAFGAGVAVGVLVASPAARTTALGLARDLLRRVDEARRGSSAVAPTAGPAAIDLSD